MDVDSWALRLENAAFGCGKNCKNHLMARERIKADLLLFMGEVIDMFEVKRYGDPLPQEEREMAEHLAQKIPATPFGTGRL